MTRSRRRPVLLPVLLALAVLMPVGVGSPAAFAWGHAYDDSGGDYVVPHDPTYDEYDSPAEGEAGDCSSGCYSWWGGDEYEDSAVSVPSNSVVLCTDTTCYRLDPAGGVHDRWDIGDGDAGDAGGDTSSGAGSGCWTVQVLERDSAGNIVYDTSGDPVVDYTYQDGPDPPDRTVGPAWYGGGSGTWWGTKTYQYDLCGDLVNVVNNVICGLQQCVNEAAAPAVADRNNQIRAFEPTIETNPTDEPVVHIPTWFWDPSPTDPIVTSNSHPSAPVTVVARGMPSATHFSTEQGNGTDDFLCGHPDWPTGRPYAGDPDDDEGACKYSYRRPSIDGGTFEVTARREYGLSCRILAPSGYSLPPGCSRALLSGEGSRNIPVVEMQAVNR